MKRVLITGATGFVGANLVRRLLSDGHEVHALVRSGFQAWRIDAIQSDLCLHTLDMADADAVSRAVAAIRPEWIFHLAVHGAYSSQTSIREMIATNLVSTVNLVEACLATGFEALINTGSSSEYGFKDHPPSEMDWLEPNSAYAVTKASATLYCRMIAQTHRANVTTLRLYSVYGAYEEPTRLIPTLIAHGLRGALPPLVNPEIARDFVYTEDVNDAYLRAAQATLEAGAVYNVGSGTQTTLRELVETARRIMQIERTPEWGSMPERTWDTRTWVADPGAIQQALGWQATTSFADGLRATVDWLQAHPELHPLYGVENR